MSEGRGRIGDKGIVVFMEGDLESVVIGVRLSVFTA